MNKKPSRSKKFTKKSKKRSKSKSKKRTRSYKKDGANRFKIKYEPIQKSFLDSLNNIDKYSKLKYIYYIDFTEEPEYQDLIRQTDLPNIKKKLDGVL